MYLVHIYAYPYKYTYIQVLMAQNSCISQPYWCAPCAGCPAGGYIPFVHPPAAPDDV